TLFPYTTLFRSVPQRVLALGRAARRLGGHRGRREQLPGGGAAAAPHRSGYPHLVVAVARAGGPADVPHRAPAGAREIAAAPRHAPPHGARPRDGGGAAVRSAAARRPPPVA